MRAFPLVAAGLVVAGLPATEAAAAKPKPVPVSCQLVTDPAGDGQPVEPITKTPLGPSRDSLDILSADLGTGKKNLVAVIRMKSLAPDPLLSGGTIYRFAWKVRDVAQDVSLLTSYEGTQRAEFRPDAAKAANTKLPATAYVDPSTSSITLTVPRRDVPQLKAAGATFSALRASVSVGLVNSTGSASLGSDVADGVRTYKDLARTCVKGV